MEKEEIVRLIEHFVNEYGMFYKFKSFVESQGYTLGELGIEDEE